jgi:two-component system NtrC family sensor kinase
MISLGKLAASCVHEINNPIQGLLTFSDLMQKILEDEALNQETPKKLQEYLKLMSSELERCGNIVSGLLSFSRQIPLEYKIIDLNDILKTVLQLVGHKLELQDITLSTCLHPGPILIRGNANRMQQTLLNLIFNAIEAMPAGGLLDIQSTINLKENSAALHIRDTGSGISKKNIGHIFDPFFTTKPEGEGTGLGLSIVYGVIRNHGGKVTVQSKEGEGTVFTLTLPLPQE